MNPLFSSALHAPIEDLINRLLARDPECARRLGLYSGAVVEVECTKPRAQLFLTVHADEIRLNAVCDGEVTSRISGPAIALGRLVYSSDKSQALYDPDIQLSGDTELIQKLYAILMDLDIDWQSDLAAVIGDVATQQFGQWFGMARDWTRSSTESLRQTVDEYLHEEARLFPTAGEVEHFSDSVDEVKLRVDRLQARRERLAAKLALLDPQTADAPPAAPASPEEDLSGPGDSPGHPRDDQHGDQSTDR